MGGSRRRRRGSGCRSPATVAFGRICRGDGVAAPSLLFARAVGEYGSVVFIAGNMPMISEITPLLIITKLEQYDYAGATAIAVVMLVAAFLLLLVINLLQAWTRKRQGGL